jgi:hypothetical protein
VCFVYLIVSEKWLSSNDNLVWFCFVKKSLRKVVVTRNHQSNIDRRQYSGRKEKVKNTIINFVYWNHVEVYGVHHYVIKFVGRWFSPSTPVSPNNKTGHHDLAEILLKVALNTITLILKWLYKYCHHYDRHRIKMHNRNNHISLNSRYFLYS